ncbi:MAG: hypothetical protein LBJ67_06115 [Planctomycetaceae bacterium]|nr:hypothetical protein [Planctomycetaceae bacterium]
MSTNSNYSSRETGDHKLKVGWLAMLFVVLMLIAVGCLMSFLRGKGTHFSGEVPARLAVRGAKIPFQIKCRNNPLHLEPILGLESCVTDEQILLSLNASLPLWHPPSVPSLVHELKLWGKDCMFTKEQVGGESRTGKMMLETLLNDQLCAERTVKLGNGNGGTYLMDSPFGIHPIQSGSYDAIEYRGEPHYGKLTMLMALSDVPIFTPVTTSSGRVGTLADILQDTIMNFHWGQEQEFIGCALAFWLPPEKSWTNQFGETFTFDDLMEHLLEQPLGKGCCGGCHVPYTVVTILRIDKEHSTILSEKIRRRAEQWIKNVAKILETNQLPDGTWERDWGKTGQNGFLYGDKTLDIITLLGHHLEWIAIANEEWRPSRDCVKRAVVAVSEQIEQLPELQIPFIQNGFAV